jgi:hypothetical protein
MNTDLLIKMQGLQNSINETEVCLLFLKNGYFIGNTHFLIVAVIKKCIGSE